MILSYPSFNVVETDPVTYSNNNLPTSTKMLTLKQNFLCMTLESTLTENSGFFLDSLWTAAVE